VIFRAGQVEAVVVPLEEYRALKALEQREAELYWVAHESRYPSRPGDDVPDGNVRLLTSDRTEPLSRLAECVPEQLRLTANVVIRRYALAFLRTATPYVGISLKDRSWRAFWQRSRP
jgi:hypothetical protein